MQKYLVSEYVGNPLLPNKIFPPYALRHAKDLGRDTNFYHFPYFYVENGMVFKEHYTGGWDGGFLLWGFFFPGGRCLCCVVVCLFFNKRHNLALVVKVNYILFTDKFGVLQLSLQLHK